MNVLVVGAGMYVTGRGTAGFGTILPALLQMSRAGVVGKIVIVGTRPENVVHVDQASARINQILGTSLAVEYRVIQGSLLETIAGLAIDCAIVSVPDDQHYSVAHPLMQAGIHCLIVKPLTPGLAEARELLALQRSKGLHCAVEFHKRYDEQNLLVKKILREGSLGSPVSIVVNYSQRINVPLEIFSSWSNRTNIFQYLGVHYVDLVYFLTGFVPKKAMAIGAKEVLLKKGLDTYDSVHAMVVWQGPNNEEMITQYAIGWIDPITTSAFSDQRFYLVGSKGRIELDQKDRGVTLVTPEGGVEALNPYFSAVLDNSAGEPSFQGYGYKSIERFVLDVRDVISGKVAPESLDATRPTIRQALVSTAVTSAINESLALQGEWRMIDETT